MAPGWLTPGAYSQAYSGWTGTTVAAGSWQEVTTAPYNSDDTRYKDYYSNSGAGSGYVSGRPPAVAVDPGTGYVFEAGSVGGVMRSKTGKGSWQPISDGLPASASGDLEVIDGTLWYATGDAATGSTTYVGTGVYATSPTGTFTAAEQGRRQRARRRHHPVDREVRRPDLRGRRLRRVVAHGGHLDADQAPGALDP